MSESTGSLMTLGKLVYGTSLQRTLVRSFILAVVSLVAFKFLFIPVRVDGGSMSPTYCDRGINLVNRLAYKRSAPQRGDVVAIWIGENSHSVVLMKRIVGLPGEAIGFRDGRVTVNGVLQYEPYVTFDSDWNREPVVCGPGEGLFCGRQPVDAHRGP